MAIPKPRKDYKYTYADYLSWPDEERWEIIDGVPFGMSPEPSRKHQDLSFLFEKRLSEFFSHTKCSMYHAPFDVRLTETLGDDESESNDKIFTVVQPDIIVVCDDTKLDDKGCKGAPDLVIEIVSPSSATKDAGEKLNLYEKHGVKEYWIVYPDENIIIVFTCGTSGTYMKARTLGAGDVLQTDLFPGLTIDLSEIFQ